MSDATPSPVVLETKNLAITFGGLTALSAVTMTLHEGEILGVIGPNGAGKTTFINCVTGLYAPTNGSVRFLGKDVTGAPAHRMGKLGLARTFQIVRPFRNLTVIENVAVGAMYGTQGAGRSTRQAFERAEQVLIDVDMKNKLRADASSLTIPDLKRLELAKALAMQPKVLLLDEVMAGLHTGEIDRAVELLQRIHAQGITLLVVEHVMKAINALSQRIMVLDFGKKIADGPPQEVMNNPTVVAAYLGERYANRKAKS